MKFQQMLFIVFIFFPLMIQAQSTVNFNDFFIDKTLRIDYFHIGSAKEEMITIDKIYSYGIWAGSLTNVIDNLNNGKYYLKIYDLESGKLIYSKGFDTYFGEYRTSEPGLNGVNKSYHESAIIPNPKKKIKFTIEQRDDKNNLVEFFSTEIDPDDVMIVREKIADSEVKVFESLKNGDSHSKVDVAILSEGYTSEEVEKFKADLERFTNIFFKLEPYKSLKNNFNIYGVFKPSAEPGTDEPDAGIFKNTVLNTTFNSLGSERYLLTEDNKALRDLAAHVPYDALYIMVNHKRYGGGGIYNWVCTFTADNQWDEYLFLHEFGHSFAGLADEYYTSDVAYTDMFTQKVEPVEPNITALHDPQNIKWKSLTLLETEIPTEWAKAEYDSMDLIWQAERRELNKKIASMKREGASRENIIKTEEEYNSKDRAHSNKTHEFLTAQKNSNVVGAFEGAGYTSKGLYRSQIDCIMFTKGQTKFCKVCEEAVAKVIKFYSE